MILKPLVGKDKTPSLKIGPMPLVYHKKKDVLKPIELHLPIFAIILSVLSFLSYGVCIALYVYLKKLLC